MSRSFLIVLLLTLTSIDFQMKEVSGFFCDQYRMVTNAIKAMFVQKQVYFYLYTRNDGKPQEISCYQLCDLRNLYFDPNLRTTIIIHGYLGDYNTEWVQILKNQLLTWQPMNVIVVDSSEMFGLNYYQAAKRVVDVAQKTQNLLQQIAEKLNKNLRDWPHLHIIGHSLGAQVAGQLAEMLKNLMFVHRITALDPAKPYFDTEGSHLKLKKSSAQFVDVIHTNAAYGQNTFGLYEPLGHIDFYPNGGDEQPECRSSGSRFLQFPECPVKLIFGLELVALKMNFFNRKARGDDMICDHNQAPKFFIESISSLIRMAKKIITYPGSTYTDCATLYSCPIHDCIKMGMHSYEYRHPHYHGTYVVNTTC